MNSSSRETNDVPRSLWQSYHNPMSREALFGRPQALHLDEPMPVQMAGRGRGQRPVRHVQIATCAVRGPNPSLRSTSVGSTAARKPLMPSSTIHKWSKRLIMVPVVSSGQTNPQQLKTVNVVKTTRSGDSSKRPPNPCLRPMAFAHGHCSNEVNAFSFQCFQFKKSVLGNTRSSSTSRVLCVS